MRVIPQENLSFFSTISSPLVNLMDNYQVLHLIGEGCFGKVFKGRRKYTGEAVAMKFITTRGKTEKDLKNLRQEIAILKTLDHENIIRLIDAFETSSDFVVVTEFAHGELFEIFQDDKQLPETEIRTIAKQLIQALFYLHSNRVIHRDMKPQNILIGSNNVIKLCDFGFARAMSNKTMVLNSVKGTPLYMAPELVQEQPYNHTADLWSLGVILYELFVGTPPFYTNSLYSLINLIINDSVKYPSGMSGEFKSFIQGLLQKNPKQRLSWPQLMYHPFVCDTVTQEIPTSIATPRHNQTDEFLAIIESFDVKRTGLENLPIENIQDFTLFIISVIESMSRRRRRRISVITFLVHTLQLVSLNPSLRSHELVIILFNNQEEILDSLITIVESFVSGISYEHEEVGDADLSQVLRLLGLLARESPKVSESVLSKFSPIGTQLLKCGNRKTFQSSLINCCKCFAVLARPDSDAIGRQLTQLLMGLVIGGVSRLSRSALHALNQLNAIEEIIELISTSFLDSVVAHISVASDSSGEFASVSPIKSPRRSEVDADPSAIQLLSRLCRFEKFKMVMSLGSLVSTTAKSGLPLLLDLPGKPDTGTICMAYETMANCGSDVSPDIIRMFIADLVDKNPWRVAFGTKFVAASFAVIKVAANTPRHRAVVRLEEAVNDFLIFIIKNIPKWISEFSRADGLKHPLDGFVSLCNLSGPSACRRFLRAALPNISGGIRSLLGLCSDPSEVANCLATAITSSSKDEVTSSAVGEMIRDVLVVLQALMGSDRKNCDKLIETFLFLMTAPGHPQPELDLIDGLVAGHLIPGLISTCTKTAILALNFLLSLSGQPGLVASANLVKAGGLCVLKPFLIWPSSHDFVVTEVLGIISNVSRSSADYYPLIDSALNPYDDLRILLEQAPDEVRAKVCNTIGNMCRHNDYFYKKISGLIPGLISACTKDGNCRKFGSFALGNTAFHSALLYAPLTRSISVLVKLLKDKDEKTRANAAGALGNLVRNSHILVSEMVNMKAVEGLIDLVVSKPVIDSSGKIALFSLGNLAMHSASRELLIKLGCAQIAVSVGERARATKDSQTVKYCDRLVAKLNKT